MVTLHKTNHGYILRQNGAEKRLSLKAAIELLKKKGFKRPDLKNCVVFAWKNK